MDKNAISTVEHYKKCGLNVNKESMLLITVDGDEVSVCNQIEKLTDVLYKSKADEIHVSKSIEEYNLIWDARRASFAAAARLAPDVVTDDIIVPRRNLSKMAVKCRKIAEKYNLKMCLIGHAGDGNLHPQFALNLESDDEFKQCMDARAKMYEEVTALGGSISAEHGIGLEKKLYMNKSADIEAIEYMKLIKRVFDPKNILNPGKIF